MVYLIKSAAFETDENGNDRFFFLLKIGYTSEINKESRFSAYSTDNVTHIVLCEIPGATEEHERRLHRKFDSFKYSKGKEWFYYDQSIVDYMKTVTLEELDKLPGAKIGERKQKLVKDIIIRVISDLEQVDDCLKDVLNNLGSLSIEEDNLLDYLKTSNFIDKDRYNTYLMYRSRKFVDYDEDNNKRLLSLIDNINSTPIIADRLKMVVSLYYEKSITLEEYNLIIYSLDRKTSDYLLSLGPDGCKACGYNVTEIKGRLNRLKFDKSILKSHIYSNFKIGEKISLSKIKGRLFSIYDSVGYSAYPRAIDLKNYFDIKNVMFTEVQSDGTKKRVKGFIILAKK